MTTEVSERAQDGTFLPGVSGNKQGRPKGKKNQITELKQDLEIALRQNVTLEQVQGIVVRMVREAKKGNVGAAKLILDKVLSNAKIEEDSIPHSGGIVIRIQNATFQAGKEEEDKTIIDVTPEETENE